MSLNLYTGSKEELIDRCRGKVWEIRLSEEEMTDFEGRYLVSKKELIEGGVLLRLVSQERLGAGAYEVEAGLGDAYLGLVQY